MASYQSETLLAPLQSLILKVGFVLHSFFIISCTTLILYYQCKTRSLIKHYIQYNNPKLFNASSSVATVLSKTKYDEESVRMKN